MPHKAFVWWALPTLQVAKFFQKEFSRIPILYKLFTLILKN